MSSRRQFLATAFYTVLASPCLALPSSMNEDWVSWSDRYVSGGRVVDAQQGGISHSEGQGYGLLLAQAFGDRKRFEEIESWTKGHLAVRQDRLMAWKWTPGARDNIASWYNATDGDLFRAWALLRAEQDSGWAEYGETAIGLARDIADLCLAADPRAQAEWLLLPGAEARRSASHVLFNPSYIMPRALRELGNAANEPRLIRAADHGETVLAELAETGFLPNWVDITDDGFANPAEHDSRWGYDALRIPLYLTWSGRADHAAVRLAVQTLDRGTLPGHLVVEASSDKQILAQSDRAGFLAIHALAQCDKLSDRLSLSGDYYADSLLMLARVAQRESNCRT